METAHGLASEGAKPFEGEPIAFQEVEHLERKVRASFQRGHFGPETPGHKKGVDGQRVGQNVGALIGGGRLVAAPGQGGIRRQGIGERIGQEADTVVLAGLIEENGRHIGWVAVIDRGELSDIPEGIGDGDNVRGADAELFGDEATALVKFGMDAPTPFRDGFESVVFWSPEPVGQGIDGVSVRRVRLRVVGVDAEASEAPDVACGEVADFIPGRAGGIPLGLVTGGEMHGQGNIEFAGDGGGVGERLPFTAVEGDADDASGAPIFRGG